MTQTIMPARQYVKTSMQDIDSDRGTGRTAKQMMEAPKFSVFVWCNGRLDYPKALARKHGRVDLMIVSPDWLSDQRWRWLSLSGIVVDHATRLTDRQFDGLEGAQWCLNRKVKP